MSLIKVTIYALAFFLCSSVNVNTNPINSIPRKMVNKFNTGKKYIEMQNTENKENKENGNNHKRQKQSLQTCFASNLTQAEEKIHRKHVNLERHEIRTVHKYERSIDEYNRSIDAERAYDLTKTPFATRCKYVELIIKIHSGMNACDDTLYLFMNIFDRYVQKNRCASKEYLKTAIASFLIALKYEEVEWPDIRTIINKVYGHETTFITKESEITEIEKHILNGLDHNFDFVNPLYFLRKSNKTDGYDEKIRQMAKYLLEQMHLNIETYKFKSRIKATTSVYIARKLCNKDSNKNLFWLYSGTSREDIVECFYRTYEMLKDGNTCGTIDKKYSTFERMYVTQEVKEAFNEI